MTLEEFRQTYEADGSRIESLRRDLNYHKQVETALRERLTIVETLLGRQRDILESVYFLTTKIAFR